MVATRSATAADLIVSSGEEVEVKWSPYLNRFWIERNAESFLP